MGELSLTERVRDHVGMYLYLHGFYRARFPDDPESDIIKKTSEHIESLRVYYHEVLNMTEKHEAEKKRLIDGIEVCQKFDRIYEDEGPEALLVAMLNNGTDGDSS